MQPGTLLEAGVKKKKSGGRRAGQSAKAHAAIHVDVTAMWQKLDPAEQQKLLAQKITPETIEFWRHGELASRGNFSIEVQMAAFRLGELVEQYKKILKTNRDTLEMNRPGVEIPLPMLPGSFTDLKSLNEDEIRELKFNKTELHYLDKSAHAAIWAMQGSRWVEALSLLTTMMLAAEKNDTYFFDEFARRIKCGVPLHSPAEPVFSALLSLKECYLREHWQPETVGRFYARETPLLVPVLKCPLGKRPPLTVPQIGQWVWAFAREKKSDRALIRAAKILGIPIAGRGRPKTGT